MWACVCACGIMLNNLQGYNGGWAKGHLCLETSITMYMYMYMYIFYER